MLLKKISFACALTLIGVSAQTNADTQVSFGGYIKYDAIFSQYSDAQRAGNVGDDFLVPSTIAVGDGSAKGDWIYDSNGKFSRINAKTVTDTENGVITSFIEVDFNGANDERLTNQASNGLRHAFVSWKQLNGSSILTGQTWSTLFNTGALPEAVDFIGPTSGSLFIRQPQVRYTLAMDSGKLMFAAENPSVSFYDGGHGSTDASNNQVDDSVMPDLIARYDSSMGNLNYSTAVMARSINYTEGADDDSATGVAVTVSGKYSFKNGDDFKFMLSSGNLGRYIALNAFRDGSIDANGDIDLNSVTGGFIAYKHNWNGRLRSTFMYAASVADNSADIIADVTKSVDNINVNLMYSPIKKLTFGVEYQVAQRETELGVDGDLARLQFTSKYSF